MERLSPEHLRALRNDLAITLVLEYLGIPTYRRNHRLSFRCPRCARTHSAVYLESNLARCFPCQESFNPIDLVMAERNSTFLDAVKYLETLLSSASRPPQLWAPATPENLRDYRGPSHRS